MRTLCIPQTTFAIFMWLLSVLSMALLLPLLIYGFLKTLKLSLPKSFKITYIITVFVLLIAGISFPIHQMFNFTFSGYCDNFGRLQVTVPMSLGSYTLSLACICCLYLVRFIVSFKGSPYFISTYLYIILIIGMLIQFILVVMVINYAIKVWWALVYDKSNYLSIQQTLSHIFLTFTAVNILYNISLCYLFLRMLYLLRKQLPEHDDITNLLKPCAVHTLCLILAFSSTLIATIFGVIRTNFIKDTNDLFMIRLTLNSLDILINSLSINLQFKYSQKRFKKHCKCCATSLFSCYLKFIYELTNNEMDDIQLDEWIDSTNTTTKNTTNATTTNDTTTFK